MPTGKAGPATTSFGTVDAADTSVRSMSLTADLTGRLEMLNDA
jgi:hypothetical protein